MKFQNVESLVSFKAWKKYRRFRNFKKLRTLKVTYLQNQNCKIFKQIFVIIFS